MVRMAQEPCGFILRNLPIFDRSGQKKSPATAGLLNNTKVNYELENVS